MAVAVVEISIASASSGTVVVAPGSFVVVSVVMAGAVEVLDEMAEAIWSPLTEEVKELGLGRFVCDVLRVVSDSFVI